MSAVRLVTMGPVFLFGTALLALGVVGWAPLSLFVAVVLALPVLAAIRPGWLGRLLLPSIVLFLLDGLLTWAVPGFPTGGAADLIAGVFLGLPLWFLGLALGSPDRPGMSLLALIVGLFEIVTTGSALASVALPVSPEGFLRAWFTAGGHQLGALASAIGGGGLSGAQVFPLASYADPLFVGLAFLALGGALLPLLDIEETPVAPVQRPSRRDLAPSVRRSPPPVLYASAEPSTPPRRAPGVGLTPIAGAVLAVAAFEGIAAAAPAYSFTLVTIVAVASLLLLVRLQRPPRPTRALRVP